MAGRWARGRGSEGQGTLARTSRLERFERFERFERVCASAVLAYYEMEGPRAARKRGERNICAAERRVERAPLIR
jgi:hypothetical protein